MNAFRHLTAAISGLALAFCLLAPVEAVAEGKEADVTVHVVRASKKPGKTDPRLGKFKKQFGDFSYKSFEVVSVKQARIREGGTETVDLPAGKKLSLNFRSVGKDGKARMKLSIPSVVETTVSLPQGGDVILGGPAMPDGDGVIFVPVTLNRIK